MENSSVDWEKVLQAVQDTNVLIKHLIAIELYLAGVSQEDIGKNLHVAKATVNEMVKGVRTRDTARQRAQKKRTDDTVPEPQDDGNVRAG